MQSTYNCLTIHHACKETMRTQKKMYRLCDIAAATLFAAEPGNAVHLQLLMLVWCSTRLQHRCPGGTRTGTTLNRAAPRQRYDSFVLKDCADVLRMCG